MKKYLNVIVWLIVLLPTTLFADNEINLFAPQHKLSRSISQNVILQGCDTIDVDNGAKAIKGISITADIIQKTERSFVRVILEDVTGKEFLVGECSRIFNENDTVYWNNYSEETCNLDSVFPHFLKIIAVEADVILHNVNIFELAESLPQKKQALNRDSLQLMQIEKKVAAINNYNIRHNVLWRAGVNSVALKPYAEKKQLLGMTSDSCNTAGFEYYKSGIFVMPASVDNDTSETRALNETNAYVKSFDWRNRHGRNWITPPKKQVGLTCWAFAAASVVESYINLYFNRILNYDLSEQDLIINGDPSFDVNLGGRVSSALNYIKQNGVVLEECYPFTYIDDSIAKCQNPEEVVKIKGYTNRGNASEAYLKYNLIKSPLCVDLFWFDGAGHSVLFVGYDEIAVGDSVMLKSYVDEDPLWTVINENCDYVGKTKWIIKNSYAEDWGMDGYAYIITDSLKYKTIYSISGAVTSLVYDEENILCTDNDGDGYYFWGVGEKPDHCPAWALEEADGDDSDYTKGPMNEYGYCRENLPHNDTIYITSDTIWNERLYLYENVVICENVTLTISNHVTFYKGVSMTIADGGQLIADSCSIDNVILRTEPGSKIILKNNGMIKHNKENCFTLSSGSELEIISGIIE